MKLTLNKILIATNIGFLILFFVYKEAYINQKEKAQDYAILLSDEKEKKFTDSKGREHTIKTVEVINNATSLKQDPAYKELLSEFSKLKKIISLSQISSTSEYNIFLKDSIIIKDSIICKNYESEFLSIHGCNDSLKITTKDSLAMAVYWKRKHKLLFFRVGKKIYESEIINFNPYSKISYNKNVIVRKK